MIVATARHLIIAIAMRGKILSGSDKTRLSSVQAAELSLPPKIGNKGVVL